MKKVSNVIPEKSNKKFWNFAKFVYMAARVTPPE